MIARDCKGIELSPNKNHNDKHGITYKRKLLVYQVIVIHPPPTACMCTRDELSWETRIETHVANLQSQQAISAINILISAKSQK